MTPRIPIIHGITERGDGREELDLEFSNGERRLYRRQRARGNGAVVMVAISEPGVVLLTREYACGLHRYELGLPRGRIDDGETPLQAANRELKEEVGFGARRLQVLRTLSLVPSYMDHVTHLVLAQDLYPERLPGDEPEQLEVLPWRLDALDQLMLRDECSEGRALAALFIAREWLARNPDGITDV
ncbi:MAG: ADP compounds hydrolase NudE [Gammaproteobacteria bacterium HGW-Gammaproteobacteria-4]|jgi:ADP-ribose diphosphatase|nr:MAG: ADP compounds hydrolase NudE [Gammaproteobacteria bacterium HGW-Gammaproteobacteria-4]